MAVLAEEKNFGASYGVDTGEPPVSWTGAGFSNYLFAYQVGDTPAQIQGEVAARGYTFAYLVDEDQSVAGAFNGACTSDFLLFDTPRARLSLQFGDSRPGKGAPINGKYLREAGDAVLAAKAPAEDQTPSTGYNIRWN